MGWKDGRAFISTLSVPPLEITRVSRLNEFQTKMSHRKIPKIGCKGNLGYLNDDNLTRIRESFAKGPGADQRGRDILGWSRMCDWVQMAENQGSPVAGRKLEGCKWERAIL
jgi:hypothetical protein